MAAPRLTKSELRFLRALLRRKVRFMVVGLSAAALQGAPVMTQDLLLLSWCPSERSVLSVEFRECYVLLR